MTFVQLKTACDGFRTLLRETTGRELIDAVSVDEPEEPENELHFLKLVSWCYVFAFEASQPAVRYIVSLLRAANPNDHTMVSSVFETVNNLRTVRVHNLSPQSKRDDYRRRQAHIWLLQNGGNPVDWSSCCRALVRDLTSAICCLVEKWTHATVSNEDAASVVANLIVAIDREWPPHAFDRMIENAASDIGLSGFDYMKYRESRLERWRELASFFNSRDHGEVAMNAVIRLELEQLFGRRATSALPTRA